MFKWVGLGVSIALSACTSTEMIRPQTAEVCVVNSAKEPEAGKACGSAAIIKASIPAEAESAEASASPPPDHVLMHFVEFTEQGHFHSRAQLDAVLQSIRQRGGLREKPQDVVVFIHGWRHDARAEDENVKQFQALLTNLAKNSHSRHVVGVYVGWRGASTNLKALDLATIWDRKNVSMEVGRGAVFELLQRLRPSPKHSKDRLVAIGHSLGASVLMSAVRNQVYGEVIQDLDAAGCGAACQPGAAGASEKAADSLYVLVNPAIEATHFLEVHDVQQQVWLKGKKALYNQPGSPRMVVLTSEGDSDVGFWFPLSRTLSIPLETHIDLTRQDRLGLPVRYGEYDMDKTAVGLYAPFQTHRLKLEREVSNSKCAASKSHWGKEPATEGWSRSFPASGSRLEHLGKSPPYPRAWVVAVDRQLIANHGDIWRSQFNCFVEELVLTTAESSEQLRPDQPKGVK
ncbi:alpha/beta hydrolase [Ideonella paludis]|uniref:Alpha/beta hydrolase n=2 Tax=Ideonella paludis TaxID=1233411 RepID=A0ABS5DY89_9BURK|nr:hypothetical protein [Ideonella paludis]